MLRNKNPTFGSSTYRNQSKTGQVFETPAFMNRKKQMSSSYLDSPRELDTGCQHDILDVAYTREEKIVVLVRQFFAGEGCVDRFWLTVSEFMELEGAGSKVETYKSNLQRLLKTNKTLKNFVNSRLSILDEDSMKAVCSRSTKSSISRNRHISSKKNSTNKKGSSSSKRSVQQKDLRSSNKKNKGSGDEKVVLKNKRTNKVLNFEDSEYEEVSQPLEPKKIEFRGPESEEGEDWECQEDEHYDLQIKNCQARFQDIEDLEGEELYLKIKEIMKRISMLRLEKLRAQLKRPGMETTQKNDFFELVFGYQTDIEADLFDLEKRIKVQNDC